MLIKPQIRLTMLHECMPNPKAVRQLLLKYHTLVECPQCHADCAGAAMYESDDIVKYLFNNYGDGKVPWGLSLGIITALSCSLALIPRYALSLHPCFSSHMDFGPCLAMQSAPVKSTFDNHDSFA